MKLFIVLVLVVSLTPAVAAAQTSGNAVVDSAAVARAAVARARSAAAQGNLASARTELLRATQAWPAQPAYWWSLALVTAAQHDTAGAVRALGAYARLGLGRDVSRVQQLQPLLTVPAVAAVAAELERNGVVRAAGRTIVTLPDSSFWPEDVEYDEKSRTYYVTSVRQRTIAAVGANGAARELLPRQTPGIGAVLATAFDRAQGKLWAVTSGLSQMAGYAPADSAIGALLLLDPRNGNIERRRDLPASPGSKVLGSVAVGRDGHVYITDSRNPVLYDYDPKRDAFVPITSPLFRSLQGIAQSSTPHALYVADYSHGILRVDLRNRAVHHVPYPDGVTTLGCDGLAAYKGSLICVQNGVAPARVVRFHLSDDGARITSMKLIDRNPALADEPTSGRVVGSHFIYVGNSQWEKYEEDGTLKPGAVLDRPRLISVPID